jgi:hypothetical protein
MATEATGSEQEINSGVTPPPAEGGGVNQETPEEKLTKIQADLDRRDRELYAKESAIKAYQKQIDEYGNLKKLVQEKPLEAIRSIGLDPLTLANAMMGNEDIERENKPSQEIAELRKEINELKSHLTKSQQNSVKEAEIAKIRSIISANSDKFGVTMTLGGEGDKAAQDIWRRVEQHYNETGKVPDYNEILAKAEAEYENNIIPTLTNLLKLEKIKKRLEGTPEKKKESNSGFFQTLSNRDSQDLKKEVRFMTDEEKEIEALKILRDSYKKIKK